MSQDEQMQDTQRMTREAHDVVPVRRAPTQNVVPADAPVAEDGSSSTTESGNVARPPNAQRDTGRGDNLLNDGQYVATHSCPEDINIVGEELTQPGVMNCDRNEVFPEVLGGHEKKRRISGSDSLAKAEPHEQTSFSSDGRTPGSSSFDTLVNTLEDRVSRIEIKQDRLAEQNLTIMELLKQLNAKLDKRGPDSSDSGAGAF